MRQAAVIFFFAVTLNAEVRVAGDLKNPLTLDSLAEFPASKITIQEKGQPVSYTAVLLAEVLKRAGASFDESMSNRELHLKAMTTCLLITAKDGYKVIFSLAEVDPKNSGAGVKLGITADHSFFLSAPADLTHARDVRDVTQITVLRVNDPAAKDN